MWISLIVATALAAASPEVEVGTLDGTAVAGAITELTTDGVTLSAADGDRTISADQLLYVAPKQAPGVSTEKPSVWIELIDGSRLTATGYTVSKGTATVNAGGDSRFEIPTSAIRRVRFSAPDDAASTWPADIGKNAAGDLLAVRKLEAVDFLEGVLGDVTEETVEFQLDGETIPVKRAKIDGFVYFHKAGDRLADPACVVDDSSGWRLNAKSVLLADGRLEVTTVAGPVLRRPWDEISRVDFSIGKVVYLSDLEPQRVEWKALVDFGDSAPSLAQYYAPRRDRGREGGPLRLDGKSYTKGLALASRTSITYRLPAGATKFKAVAGIDDGVHGAGHLLLKISADGKQLFSAPIAGLADPVALDLDVSGARQFTILVDYGEDLDIGDYLNLADARIVK